MGQPQTVFLWRFFFIWEKVGRFRRHDCLAVGIQTAVEDMCLSVSGHFLHHHDFGQALALIAERLSGGNQGTFLVTLGTIRGFQEKFEFIFGTQLLFLPGKNGNLRAGQGPVVKVKFI